MDNSDSDNGGSPKKQVFPVKVLLTILVPIILILLILIPIEVVYGMGDGEFRMKNDLRCLAFSFTLLCEHLNVRSFAHSGTLLGIVRSGDIIEHDDDVDLGILETDLKTIQDFCDQENNQWTLKKSAFIRDGSLYSFSHKCTSFFIDVFLFTEVLIETNQTYSSHRDFKLEYSGECKKRWPNESFAEEPWIEVYPLGKFDATSVIFTDLMKIVCENHRFIIIDGGFAHAFVYGPKNPIPYLLQAYGDTWREPKFYNVHSLSGYRKSALYFSTIFLFLGVLTGCAFLSHIV
jgi:hypothetical protein